MGGNRRFGYRRGNSNGRRPIAGREWFCWGCKKLHHPNRERTAVGPFQFCESSFERAAFTRPDKERMWATSAGDYHMQLQDWLTPPAPASAEGGAE